MYRMVVVAIVALFLQGCHRGSRAGVHGDVLLKGTFPDGTQITVRADMSKNKNSVTGIGRLAAPLAQENIHVFSGSITPGVSATLQGTIQGSNAPFTIQATAATKQISMTFTVPGFPPATVKTVGQIVFK